MTPSFYVVSLLYSLGFNQKVNMKKVGYKLLQFSYPGSSVYLTIKWRGLIHAKVRYFHV